jgi:hypothetical protein
MRSMGHEDFYHLLSKYKFVLAAENAVCDDYITEKFWRSFYVGTIPIVYGSPSVEVCERRFYCFLNLSYLLEGY